jgi:N-acetylglutamate synthase-like GNAT family acetyltransferase
MAEPLMIRERPPQSGVVALLEAEGLPASDLTEAASHQVRALYLLATTAEAYFEHRGYRRIDRTQAPPSIQSTREFASLCPASSVFMIKRL